MSTRWKYERGIYQHPVKCYNKDNRVAELENNQK